jgi:integrase
VDQAGRLVDAAFADPTVMRPYVIVSLLTGARTEELRALTWVPSRPRCGSSHHVAVALGSGDRRHKTRKSRRTLELPALRVEVLRAHRVVQLQTRVAAGERWAGLDLVFSTGLGSPLDAANGRRAIRRVAEAAGLDAEAWTPRELRHSFVSLLSSTGPAIEDIAHLVGHANTQVTESVYRKELRPVLTRGAGAMDALFPRPVGNQIGKQGS